MKIIIDDIGRPQVAEGKPTPMLPTSFVEWLEPKLDNEMWVFEYGLGNSTLWFHARVGEVDGIDHNILWFNAVRACITDRMSARLYFQSGADPYVWRSAMMTEDDGFYDIIVVDGIRREECLNSAIDAVALGGIIIFDNSEQHPTIFPFMEKAGFQRKDFHGVYSWATEGTPPQQTSVFFKDGNRFSL